ncbi:threonine/serine dehydratase [Acuticoccus sp. I52.16.1]|uniref:threonine/serine dehydratase n=1 Tax=Acuticoccus sp. I52.16.1 TaxID=2928472 RepID=UPI001FD0AB47|nr:threonine/serine dehydratase [Acuticoccus sp. I52.16.1]UOM36506.1 threonine/serine dehydratase [Acuticoccus sp. I52.16.1]
MDSPVDRAAIEAAAARIAPHVRRTPLMRLEAPVPCELKLEQLQATGSFKVRGAFNTLLSVDVPAGGVAAASGGNHGAAVAYAASVLGHKATIFVPTIASPAKLQVIREAGADITILGERYAEALEASEAFQAASGAIGVHAYDAPLTVAGQGTVGAEWEADSAGLDTVLVAVGGGGLISGIAAWFQNRVKVVGVEPEGSCAMAAALKAGRPVAVEVNSVAADSLGSRSVGVLNYELARRFVERVVLVEDEAIVEAQRTLWRQARIVTEPGGATAYAALQSGAYQPAPGERVGVLVCGANTDPVSFSNAIAKEA